MRRLPAVFALPLVFGLSFAALAKSDKSKVVKKALFQSVRVEAAVGGKVVSQASGVVVASDGETSWVLTNAHVVEPATQASDGTLTVILERPSNVRAKARLLRIGKVPEEDLALLAVDRPLPPVSVAAEEDVSVGDDIVVIGAPYGRSYSRSDSLADAH